MGLFANKTPVASPTDWWRSLPFEYQDLKVSTDSRPVGFRFSKHIVNIEAKFRDTDLVVCGEADSQELAVTKAVAELLERTAMKSWLDQEPGRKIETSNGFAAHTNAELARQSAIFERIERDAVLTQWYTATPFIQITEETYPAKLRSWSQQELSQSEFPTLKILLSTQGLGPSVTCILLNRDGFGVSGHSTKTDLLESIDSAVGEACRAAHLYLRKSFWKDCMHLRSGEVGAHRIQPAAHALYYAYCEPFPSWMFGQEINLDEAQRLWENRVRAFAESSLPTFSFEVLLEEPLVVGYAQSQDCFYLTWGPCNPAEILSSNANRRLVAPITELSLNRMPHIVA
jgi:ribosomal protein S12 methylthiotransferase accessory factor YcaO